MWYKLLRVSEFSFLIVNMNSLNSLRNFTFFNIREMCQVRSPKAVEQNKVYYCKLKFKIQILCTMQDQIKSTEWKYFFRIFFFSDLCSFLWVVFQWPFNINCLFKGSAYFIYFLQRIIIYKILTVLAFLCYSQWGRILIFIV